MVLTHSGKNENKAKEKNETDREQGNCNTGSHNYSLVRKKKGGNEVRKKKKIRKAVKKQKQVTNNGSDVKQCRLHRTIREEQTAVSSSYRLLSHQQTQNVSDFKPHSLDQQKGTTQKKRKGMKRKEMENKNTDTSTFVNGHNQHLRTSTVASQTLTKREEKRLQKNIAHIPSPKRSNQQKKNRCIRYASFVIIRVCQRGPVNYHHIDTNAIRASRNAGHQFAC